MKVQNLSTKALIAEIRKNNRFQNTLVLESSAVVFKTKSLFFQGLLLERTPYLQTFYVWELIYPLFHPNANLALNFSRRIGQGKTFVGSAVEICDQIGSCVRDDELLKERLFQPISNQDFLDIEPLIREHPENFPSVVVFDVAVVMLLEEMSDQAAKLLHHIWNERSVRMEEGLLHLLVKRLLDHTRGGSSARDVVEIVAECNRGHMLAR